MGASARGEGAVEHPWPGALFAKVDEADPGRNIMDLHISARGDLNGDGRDDVVLAVAGPAQAPSSLRLILFISGPDGHSRVDLGFAEQISAVQIADISGDGRDDLLVLSRSRTLSVYLQEADGTLAEPVSTSISGLSHPTWDRTTMLVGDVTGDGANEVVVVSANLAPGSGAALLTGFVGGVPGEIRFSPGTAYEYARHAVGLLDVNVNGRLDLVRTDIAGAQVSYFDGEIFLAHVPYLIGGPAFLADVDGDGIRDVCRVRNNTLRIRLMGQNPPQDVEVPFPPFWGNGPTLVGDFNGDGREDVLGDLGGLQRGGRAVTDIYPGPYRIHGQFTARQAPVGTAVADLDGDGRDDILIVSEGWVSQYRGSEPHPTLPGSRTQIIDGFSARSVSVADLTGNGLGDLAISGEGNYADRIIIQTEPGVFAEPVLIPVFQGGDYAVAGDWDGDGRTDIAWRSLRRALPVQMNTGQGPDPDATLIYEFSEQVGVVRSAAAARLTPDRHHLIVSTPGHLHRLSVQDGALVLDQTIPTGWTAQSLRPMNADPKWPAGVAGVIVHESRTRVMAFPHLDNGTLGEAVQIAEMIPWPSIVAMEITDLDGDGLNDIVIFQSSTNPNSAAILWGGLDGFAEPQFLQIGQDLHRLRAADLDGDGLLDLVGSQSENYITAGSVIVLTQTHPRQFEITARIPGLQTRGSDVGDLSGNGLPDIVVASDDSFSGIRMLYNPLTPPCPADLNGDGSLNFFDIARAIALFNAGDPAIDLAEPFGTINFFDLAAYLNRFNAGCP